MTNNDRLKPYYPIILAFVLVTGMYLGSVMMSIKFSSFNNIKSSLFNIDFNNYDKFNDILNYINDSYVDSVNRVELVDDAIVGLLHKLDPHSAYITAADYQQMNESLLGNFEGIGVEFRIEQDTVVVISTISGGPSEKVGLRAGDRIVMVDDTLIAGVDISNEEVMKKLKGPKNTKVKVSIQRRNIESLIDYEITRDVIPSYSVDIAYMVNNEIGYIKINRFSATTYTEFINAVSRLRFKGMDKLIIDLRGNGGGYLNAAIQIADEFLEKDDLIVYTEGLNRPRSYAYATSIGDLKQTPFVILIDEWSASASEVLSGALQDNDKGVIIGRRSFGKGLVQEQIELMDGSAIRLTVARYYTPSGRSIQRPYSDDVESYYMDFYKRFFESDDTLKQVLDTNKFYSIGGKVLYGGGGITPDIEIKINEDKYSDFYSTLNNRGLIYEYSFYYVDNYRDSLKTIYNDANNFNRGFNITPKVYTEFNNYCLSEGVSRERTDTINSDIIIKTQMKAYIGRNLFSYESFYPVIHKIDDTFLKAVEVLSDTAIYNAN
ncbi:MAG: S41 family peptidase [Bacteroidales bacterium]|nr:S41 family peptidase [Bacteroidales bacterium]